MFKKHIDYYTSNKSIAGIVLMIVHSIAISAILIIAKRLIEVMHPEQVTFLYKAGVVIAVLPWCCNGGGLVNNLRTTKIGLHMLRGIFSALATICLYYALKSIQVMDATAITYLEQIIIIAIGIFYFKEKATKAKMFMVIMGILGALLVIKPGFQEFNYSYFYLFGALLFWALNNLSVKVLGKTEKSRPQVFYAAFFGSIASLLLSWNEGWREFEPHYLKYVGVLALLYFIHTMAFFKAFKFADMSLVMPFDYTRILFSGIFGYFWVQEIIPDTYSLFGYFFIALGGIYLIMDEGRRGWRKETERQFKNDVTTT